MRSGAALAGGPIAPPPLHFFWLLDGSSSMAGQKIMALNFVVWDAIPPIRRAFTRVPALRLLVRAVRFATDVDWIIREPTPISELEWHDIVADRDTATGKATGKAVDAVVDELDKIDTSRRLYPPILVLVTDGRNTDGKLYNEALRRLATHPIGRHARRYAIAIGRDANIEELQAFIGNDETPVFDAADLDMLPRVLIAPFDC